MTWYLLSIYLNILWYAAISGIQVASSMKRKNRWCCQPMARGKTLRWNACPGRLTIFPPIVNKYLAGGVIASLRTATTPAGQQLKSCLRALLPGCLPPSGAPIIQKRDGFFASLFHQKPSLHRYAKTPPLMPPCYAAAHACLAIAILQLMPLQSSFQVRGGFRFKGAFSECRCQLVQRWSVVSLMEMTGWLWFVGGGIHAGDVSAATAPSAWIVTSL